MNTYWEVDVNLRTFLTTKTYAKFLLEFMKGRALWGDLDIDNTEVHLKEIKRVVTNWIHLA